MLSNTQPTATAKQLALSTVPTYYLVDPEGNLAASSNEWSEIKTAIETAIEVE